MPSKPIELPPEVAKAFVRDMFAAKDSLSAMQSLDRQEAKCCAAQIAFILF
jgi:hypothetical protein